MTDPIVRANDAKFLLQQPLFQEAKAHIEGHLQYLRQTVPITSTEMHTRMEVLEVQGLI